MRYLLYLILLVVLLGCGRESTPLGTAFEGLPVRNVVVISFDALRADALGVYGYERGTSPHIDRWASRAVIFDRAHASAQATPTSFAGAFTGRYPFRVFRGWQLEDEETLASRFRDNGFHTAFLSNNIQVMAERGFGVGFNDYVVRDAGDDEELLPQVLEWIDKAPDEPLFAWFHFLSPHTPYDARQMAERFYDPSYEGPFEETTTGEFSAETPADQARVRDLYDGEVFYADWIFRQVLDRLERKGLLEQTLIVLTADHGEEFLEHGQYQHNHVYEEVSRIPLIFWHAQLGSVVRSDQPVSNVDLFPTLAALAGFPADEKPMDGEDLTQPLPDDRVRIVAAMTHAHDRQIAIMQDRHKLILVCSPDYAELLYDLAADPGETRDIAPDDPPRVEALIEEATRLFGEDPCNAMAKATQGLPIESGLTEEQIERLRSLGYIQ
ncbi:MAG: sulfatase [Xanthomonadales bacterium]|nr:sulfatase [Xanthomonadales bacterium]